MIVGKNIGRIRAGKGVPNPLDNTFVPDERQIWDMLSYISAYMKNIHFYNVENQRDGNWSELLLKDPIFFKSTIVTASLEQLQHKALLFDQDRNSHEKESELIHELMSWYTQVSDWIDGLTKLGDMQLADKVDGIHQGILKRFKKALEKDLEELTSKDSTDSREYNIDLNRAFLTYEKAIKYIQDIIKESLVSNLYARKQHSPNNALYIAFVLLLEHTRKKVNHFPRRHLDFYFRDVLKQSEQTGQPTRTFVNFDLKPDIKRSVIDTNIKLSAGKLFGKSNDTFFGIKKPLVVHPVSIQNMYTLALNKTPYLRAGTRDPIISNVLINELIKDGTPLTDLKKEQIPLFGADFQKIQNTAQPFESIGEMGFIIASPSLFLSEGQRDIQVHFAMDHRSADTHFWKLLKEIAKTNEESVRSTFKTIFSNGFRIYHTTAEEWIEIETYKTSLDEEEDTFSIHLSIDITAPPVDILEGEKMKWPALKFILNPYAPTYLYSFIKGMKMRWVRLEVEASQLRNLTVYNDLGRIDLSTSFDLFGAIPKVGSSVKIGKSELFKKNVTSLSVDLEWDNLPDEIGGFESYFSRYPQPVSNSDYKVHFSVLNKGKWKPNQEGVIDDEELFAVSKIITEEGYEEDVLQHTSSIYFDDFRKVHLAKKNFALTDPVEFSANSLDGFIRFSLSGPEEAFGYEVYPDLVTAVSIHNARKKKDVPLPNTPFVPKVKTIQLNYKAEDSISFETSKSNLESTSHNISEFYHISPFDTHIVLKNQEVSDDSLVHDFSDDGQLFLHLKNASGVSMLSIYFDLDDTMSVENLPETPTSIFYQYKHEWLELPERSIVKDDTLGFIKSGIIELNLPENKSPDSDNSLSLRISTPSEAIKYPYLKGIYFNAIEAYSLDEDPETIGIDIPENSINKIVGAYNDINSVSQPNSSFGGVKKETQRQFYHRVANRLRHKGRALVGWDYEQLILDRFNDVEIVKCTNLNEKNRPSADQVRLVVIHKNWNERNFNLFSRDALYTMRDYLLKRSNSLVNLEIRNPKFEYLLVNCTLEMEKDAIGGHYIEEVNKEINRFLSPFSQISLGFGGLGGSIVPVILMSQLEKLDFVKKGRYLSLEHIIQQGSNRYSMGVFTGNKEVKTTTPWSIMVPMVEHNIYVQDKEVVEGIGHFAIEKDFIISKSMENREDESLDIWWKNRKKDQETNTTQGGEGLMIIKLNKDGQEK